VHVTTVASLEAPFSGERFATLHEHDLDQGLRSTLGLLRQLAGGDGASGSAAGERRDMPFGGLRNTAPAPAPAPVALTAPPTRGVRLSVAQRRCSDDGCGKTDVGGGKCTSHGGGKRCAEPACDSGARKGGKCISHGGGARCGEAECDKGAADADSAKCVSHGGGRRCDETECDRPRRKGKKCGVHSGINVKQLCNEGTCTKKAIGEDGKCKAHGGRRRCAVAQCPNVATSAKRGTCAKHAPLKTCDYVGDGDGEASCDRPATARGKCDAHGGGRARKICVEQGCETRVVSGEKCTAHGGGGGCGTEVRVFRLSQIPRLVTAPGRRPLVNQRKCTAHSTSALLPAFYGVQVESHTTTELPNP
jgi:hypothetical protein